MFLTAVCLFFFGLQLRLFATQSEYAERLAAAVRCLYLFLFIYLFFDVHEVYFVRVEEIHYRFFGILLISFLHCIYQKLRKLIFKDYLSIGSLTG